MVVFAFFFTSGVWLLQQQATLPDLRWGSLILLLLAALRVSRNALRKRDARWPKLLQTFIVSILAVLCGFFYASWMAQQRLADALPAAWQGRDIALVGVVAEMPRQHEHGLAFSFDVERTSIPDARVPQHIFLNTYQDNESPPLSLHAGERWQLTVRLKQPHGSSNPYSFDFELWALERDLRAVGYVRANNTNRRLDEGVPNAKYFIERMREAVRQHFQNVLGQAPYTGVLSALAIGDQGSIPASQWQVFTRTGVNHLMSISGLHITMLAGLGFALTYWLWRRSAFLTLCLPARKAAILAGLLVAVIYALLSGYGVPAKRTVYMLATVAAALWLSRNIAPSQLLAAALMVVLLSDPWAVMSPGFWLSFGAVGLIFFITANRLGHRHWLIEYSRMQWAMSIGLIPPLLAMFQQISLVSPLANAFAIPLVSFVVVPLTLLGAMLPFDPILYLAHQAMGVGMVALVWLNALPEAIWSQHAPPMWSVVLGMLGVLWILLPRGFPSRWTGIILLLPIFLSKPAVPVTDSMNMIIFDVGQGLAVAIQTSNHTLLYDTGPVFSTEANSGNRILLPALHGMGITHLDKLILTHNDSDHTGGASSILQSMPVNLLSSSLPEDSPLLLLSARTDRCSDDKTWDWDGVQFEYLHPEITSYADHKIKNNDRGCVLRISIGQNSVLLTADIEKKSERRLIKLHPEKLKATLLVVPHHGSKTSSTADFVAAVHPRYAVFTAGYLNRFGHPKTEIIERYRAAGSSILRSDEDGAILVEADANNFKVKSFRIMHARYWQHTRAENIQEP